MRDVRIRRSLAALLLYLVLSFLFFGRGLLGHFSTYYIGVGADAPLMMWYLVWWPHAFASSLNPFITHAYWAPDGFNLTWSTSIPLISLLAAPLTWLCGPIVSLNTFCLLGLPLAAWSAFLLCEYLSRNYLSSVLGGYVFGFCPMLLGQIFFGRLHSIWIFPIPLAAYLCARRLDQSIGARKFIAFLVLLLVTQFLSSTEIFATATLFGSIAFVIGWVGSSSEFRARLHHLAWNTAVAYTVTLLLVTPYLYFMFFYPRPFAGPIWDDRLLAADLFNFLIPTPLNELGRIAWFDAISTPFNLGLPSEQVAYLTWPLLAVAVLFARKFWHRPLGRVLFDSLLIVLICSLGQTLIVWDHSTKVILPWMLFRSSLLANAAPARFCMYAFLIFALMVSLWLPLARTKLWIKVGTAVLIVASLVPNLSAAFWVSPANTPEFFRSGLYRKYISPEENVFIFPAWPQSVSMLWQAQTRMYFDLGDGPGAWPERIARWPVVESFTRRIYLPDAARQFRGYLLNYGVTTVIVTQNSWPQWETLLSELGNPLKVDDVWIYRVTPSSGDNTLTLAQLRKPFDDQRFETLLTRVDRYLAGGGSFDDLTARNLLKLDIIPTADIAGLPILPGLIHPELEEQRDSNFKYGVVLFTSKHRVVLGESIWYPDAKRLMDRYRPFAGEVGFIGSHGSTSVKGDPVGVMVMSFDRTQLAAAAAIANASLRDAATPPPPVH